VHELDPGQANRTDVGAVEHLASVLGDVRRRIAEAAARAHREPDDVTIVAVTKTVPAARIRAAIDAGFRTFGENRVQERQAKVEELEALGADREAGGKAGPGLPGVPAWHLVGALQSNKARRAVELFDVIETVDSIDLARRLDRIVAELPPGRRLPVLVQVNVDADTAKAGLEPASVERDLGEILDLEHLDVEGLMTVGRLVDRAEAARPTFVALRALSERLRARDGRLGPRLSMGMSDDFEVAVEEGATLVRLGRVLFGARPTLR
jgi:pyridoxal phosphate enzyme (YggS family)